MFLVKATLVLEKIGDGDASRGYWGSNRWGKWGFNYYEEDEDEYEEEDSDDDMGDTKKKKDPKSEKFYT